jgi:hypothetical protein
MIKLHITINQGIKANKLLSKYQNNIYIILKMQNN